MSAGIGEFKEKKAKNVEDRMKQLEEKGFPFNRKEKFTDEYQREKFLGQGAFSKVFLYTNKITNEKRAVKIMEKRLVTSEDIIRYKREIYMIKSLDHPNIVSVKEYFEDKERIYVCLEFLKGGELFCEVNQKKKNKKRYTEKQAARIIAQIIKAVDYLHQNNIIHRDIKLENIMYVHGGEFHGSGRVKLIDFGTAVKMVGSQNLTEIAGSPNYLAPEVL